MSILMPVVFVTNSLSNYIGTKWLIKTYELNALLFLIMIGEFAI